MSGTGVPWPAVSCLAVRLRTNDREAGRSGGVKSEGWGGDGGIGHVEEDVYLSARKSQVRTAIVNGRYRGC